MLSIADPTVMTSKFFATRKGEQTARLIQEFWCEPVLMPRLVNNTEQEHEGSTCGCETCSCVTNCSGVASS